MPGHCRLVPLTLERNRHERQLISGNNRFPWVSLAPSRTENAKCSATVGFSFLSVFPIRDSSAERIDRMTAYPTVEESRKRLHEAGWSLHESCLGARWEVVLSNGTERLIALGATSAEAWYRATLCAEEVGLEPS
jgi:hypothetical protein